METAPEPEPVSLTQAPSAPPLTPTLSPSPAEPTPLPELTSVLLTVPFTAQAPLGNWNDPLQQDGCEEASALMAVSWAKNQPLGTQTEVIDVIRTIGLWEIDMFGPGYDTSAQDTADRILNQYFGWENYAVKELSSPQQIARELIAGNLVITPMDGQRLGNPYFTAPGPERHMLVIKGYDAEKLEFITNDPGTRQGENYRYAISTLWDSIRDYPTGDHVPITEIEKRMIVIKPAG